MIPILLMIQLLDRNYRLKATSYNYWFCDYMVKVFVSPIISLIISLFIFSFGLMNKITYVKPLKLYIYYMQIYMFFNLIC